MTQDQLNDERLSEARKAVFNEALRISHGKPNSFTTEN